MRRYGQIGWRMVAIAAFVGTAALAVVLTRAPGSTVAALSSEFSGPACAASGLEAWLGAAATDRAGTGLSHGAGTYYTLEFTNVSHQTCRLYGYPEVSAYQASPVTGQNPAAGSRIGGAAVRDTSVRPQPVMLAPGATAHAVLRVVVTASTQPAGCTQVTARGTRDHAADPGPARVRARAHHVLLGQGLRLAERPGHPGPAGHSRLRPRALTTFGPKGPKDHNFPTWHPAGTMSGMGVSQISLPAEGHEEEGAPPGSGTALPEERYLDREESWLRFNERVLELAEDESVPLLDRVRFLAIFATNLDEFFMVRVGRPGAPDGGRLPGRGHRGTAAGAGPPEHPGPGRPADRPARPRVQRAHQPGAGRARDRDPALERALAGERDKLGDLFRQRIYPVLTPLVVDPAHPFPFISGLSLNLAVMIADPRTDATIFARVKVPPLLPRFLAVAQNRFVPIEDVIAAHLTDLFGDVEIIEHHAFRVTRIRDLEVDEELTENLLQAMERELVRRRFEPAVRLEVEDTMSADVLERLVTELDVHRSAVYRVPGPLDLSGLFTIADLNIGELRYPAFVPSTRAVAQDNSIFTAIAERDILVHHPYDSFAASVEKLIDEAADDPRVLAIKQTLYRTSGKSPIVDALIDAAEAGKQVVVVVEIKAQVR